MSDDAPVIRLGRMGYLNVLPIYHPIESGELPGNYEIISGPPRVLNELMSGGKLDVSSNSSFEYARHHDRYLLIPDLSIGSRGPVMSVLLLSRIPLEELQGRTVLVSAQTHTSFSLLRVLFDQRYHIKADFVIGNATKTLAEGKRPEAILAIGDEALSLRGLEGYPHMLDLGEAWRSWTGLPFIFGVWIASRDALARDEGAVKRACRALLAGKKLGVERIAEMSELAAESGLLSVSQMREYFRGLVYDLGEEELEGLRVFFDKLVISRLIPSAPRLEFINLD